MTGSRHEIFMPNLTEITIAFLLESTLFLLWQVVKAALLEWPVSQEKKCKMAISLLRKRWGKSLPVDIRMWDIQAHYVVLSRSSLEIVSVLATCAVFQKKSNDRTRMFPIKVKILLVYDQPVILSIDARKTLALLHLETCTRMSLVVMYVTAKHRVQISINTIVDK